MTSSKEVFDAARKYILNRVADTLAVVSAAPDAPPETGLKDTLKEFEAVIEGKQEYEKLLTNFLRGTETNEEGKVKAAPSVLLFFHDSEKKEMVLSATHASHLRTRGAYAIRNTPPDPKKNLPKPVSVKEVDFMQEITIGVLEVNEKNKVTFLDFHRQMLESIYQPVLRRQAKWGKASEQQKDQFQLCIQDHSEKLDELMTDEIDAERVAMPESSFMKAIPAGVNYTKASSDVKLVRHFESCIENWVGVSVRLIEERPRHADQEPQNIPEEVGPITELRWWKERCAKFNTLTEQLAAPEVKTVIGVLGAARSNCVKQWREIDTRLTDASNEAKENVRYLSSLESYFEALEKESPTVIINLLPALVNNIKMMYTIARYYSTEQHMMVLFCKITNQLILACKNDIRQHGSQSAAHLWSQTTDAEQLRALIERLQACIALNTRYQEEFQKASERLKQKADGPQFSSLNILHIFGKFELFCKRVHKLIEIFDTIEQFQSLSEYNIDGMKSLIDRFFDHVEELKKKASHDPLDQSTPTFDKAFIEFNKNIAELECSLQVFINSSFENITSTENALALLKKFQLILNRKTLRSDLESKYMVIFHNYGLDLENVQKTYDRQKQNPPMVRNITPVAGSITWARQLLRRIESPMQNFKENKSIMGSQKESKKIIRTYNKIARALIEFETVWLNAWKQSIDNMKSGLNATLLVRNEGKLYVNFDIEILQLIKEARALMRMDVPIPGSAKMVLMQEQKFKTFHGQLTHAIKEYDRVVSRIIPVTRNLMTKNLEILDSIMRPGEISLTWTSMNIDGYINRVHTGLHRLDVVVTQVNNIVQNRIQANLKFISSTLLVNLPENQSFSLEQFVSLQEKHIKSQSELMDIKNCEVEKAAEDVINAILAAQKLPGDEIPTKEESMAEVTTLKSHFNNLMFKAILTTTTRSLNLIKKRVGTRGNRTDFMQVGKPFFDVNVELSPPHVLLHPSLEEVQKAINQSATAVLKCSKYISPWEGVDGSETFFEKIAKNKEIVKVVLLLTGGIHGLNKQVMDYLNSFKRYEYLWMDDKQEEYEKFLEKQPTLAMFEQELKRYKAVEDDVEGIQPSYVIGSLSLDTARLKMSLKREAQDWKSQYAKNLHQQASRDLARIQTQMDENDKALQNDIKEEDSLEDLRMMMYTLREIRERESEVDLLFDPVQENYAMLKGNNAQIPKDEEEQVGELWHHWRNLRQKAQKRNDEISKLQNGFKARLTREVDIFQHVVVSFRKDFDENGPMCEGISPSDAMERLNKYQRLFEDHKRSWTTFQAGEELFGMPVHQYPELVQTEKQLGLLEKLYLLYVKVIQKIKGYAETLWVELKQGGGKGFASLVEEVNRFQLQAQKLPKALKTWDAYLELKKYIDDFLGLEEMISALAHPAMRERHWKTIMQITATTWKLDEDLFKLGNILEAKLLNFEEEVQDVTMSAQKEADIERKYKEIERNWKDTELMFGEFKHRGQLVLKGEETNLIKESLEESQLQVGSMLASRFVAPFREEVTEWMTKLSSVSEKLGLWQEVQSAWVWLEAVFAGGDIMKQLPAEAKRFAQIDKTWVKIMTKAGEQKNVIGFCYDNELLDLLPNLKDQLDQCQKQLQSYLETKRRAFPRFYFVSETVLLDILSQASDPTAIQGNIQSIFDGVTSVTFERFKPAKGETGSGVIKITWLHSPEGESLQLLEPVPCVGNVECWLLALVDQMCVTVKEVAKRAAAEIPTLQGNLRHFEGCLKTYVAQVSLLIVQMLWTQDVQDFLQGSKSEQKALRESCDRRISDLKDMLIELTRTDLAKMERVNVETLITIHVHQQDVWAKPVAKGDVPLKKLRDATSFDWLKQARFYFRPEKEEVIIQIADADTLYCNEYLGVKERLVITPLTDRCYITLSQALAMKLGGAPAGPAGTGKTETTKDLARTYGKLCIVTNCSDQLDYKAMGKIIKGLSQANAWGCFDEFNRIDLPVLSVVAQQVQSVLNGLKAHKTEFVFPDKDIVGLKPGVGFFITMNPGYAGRQELPENLKILFRGVTMMVPDRQAIMKVKLGGQGYKEDEILSQKFYLLYNLCEQQLSKQRHYDFGLRNILSVLRTAGSVLRRAAVKDEMYLFMRTLRDMNMSKLVFDDIDLFNSLLEDLFPKKNPEKNVYVEVEKALKFHCNENGLIFHPPWVAKCIQLYETKLVRHGLMVVGPDGVGKTMIFLMVLKSLCDIDEKLGGMKHNEMRMNPKAITAPQMFGKLDAGTGDWHDGIFSSLWRQACAKTRKQDGKKPASVWLVCDGPVDAIWIENLNTVLDDNKLLTLASGDRLNMTENMKVCFEPENLNNASPATVSRAGIIYVSDAELGGAIGRGEWKPWDPVIRAKLYATRKEERIVPCDCPVVLSKEVSDMFMHLYEKHVDAAIKFYTKECNVIMSCGCAHQLINSYFLLVALLDDVEGIPSKSLAEKLFWFVLSWSLGGLLESFDREKFHDGFVRPNCKSLPDEDTVFEYRVDVKSDKWIHWNSITSDWKYPGDAKISEDFATLFIPTLDSTRLNFLMLMNFVNKRPFLLMGGSGTAKTVTIENFLLDVGNCERIDQEARDLMTFKKINFSFMTSPGLFQAALQDCVEKRQGKYYGPKRNKKLTLFIDDTAMPEINEWGDQITNEIVRQVVEEHRLYSLEKPGESFHLVDMQYAGAMAIPGGGKNDIPNRLKRHFAVFCVPLPSDSSLQQIFGVILSSRFHQSGADGSYTQATKDVADQATKMSIAFWKKIQAKMLPTPAKFHYNFNLRDLTNIVQGICKTERSTIKDEYLLVNLWKHECCRVFSDKLNADGDKAWYDKTVNQVVQEFLGDQIMQQCEQPTYWCDFLREVEIGDDEDAEPMEPPQIYEPVDTMETLRGKLEVRMSRYNEASENKTRKLSLVLFDAAIKHVVRITRVLTTKRGNILLVGVGGSGKQSLTRLSASIHAYKTFQITVSKNYGINQLFDDLREQYSYAGTRGQVCFIFTDSEIKSEQFLEYINGFLSSGEIPGLYSTDEKDSSINDIRMTAKKECGRDFQDTGEWLWRYFVNKVRSNLHFVLCMSPVGDKFRVRARKFPALISGCVIDWFFPWPEAALLDVSKQRIGSFKMETDQQTKQRLMEFMAALHRLMLQMSVEYFTRFRRSVFSTPKSYLSFLEAYIVVYQEKFQQINVLAENIGGGLKKLHQAGEDVRLMKINLAEKEVNLQQATKETDALLLEITEATGVAEKKESEVGAVKEMLSHDAKKVQAVKDDAEQDLAAAQPMLEAANKALDSIDPKALQNVKKLSNPPALVKRILDGVCILLHDPMENKHCEAVPEKGGLWIKDSWEAGRRFLSDMKAIDRLIAFKGTEEGGQGKKDQINEETCELLLPYLCMEAWSAEQATKSAKDVAGMCMWVRAMYDYIGIAKFVQPKMETLREAEAQLRVANRKLDEKEAELSLVQEDRAKCQAKLDSAKSKKQALEDDALATKKRMDAANGLIDALSGERERWTTQSNEFKERVRKLVGDVALSCAFISYCGPFNAEFRHTLLNEHYYNMCLKLKIPVTENIGIVKFLTTESQITDWQIEGLPSDDHSVQNAIMITSNLGNKKTGKYPLIVDPQGQGLKWLRSRYASGVIVTQFTDKKFGDHLARQLQDGKCLIVENVTEDIDPMIDPVLDKAIVRMGRMQNIIINDKPHDFDDEYKMVMTTRLPNPLFTPEMFAKTLVIDMTVTMQGLEQQLLGQVIGKEKSELEEERAKLIEEVNNNEKRLKEFEDRLLAQLAASKGNLIDDDDLIATLADAKKASAEIKEKLAVAQETRKRINSASEEYRPVALRGSVLYFLIVDMSNVSNMYQTSLPQFLGLFHDAIKHSEKAQLTTKRINNIISLMTKVVFEYMTRGLFSAHRLLFVLTMACKIKLHTRDNTKLSHESFQTLLKGGAALSIAESRVKPNQWLPDKAWLNVIALSDGAPKAFKMLPDCIARSERAWKEWYDIEAPESTPVPEIDDKLEPFDRLLVVRALREDRAMLGALNYVSNILGKDYAEPLQLDFEQVIDTTTGLTPIIFLLSQGSDPSALIEASAKKRKKQIIPQGGISMGQGQEQAAMDATLTSFQGSGEWALLQNCHLGLTFLADLEDTLVKFDPEAIGEEARVLITSEPHPKFPIGLLQMSIKLTNEPPPGIKAGIKRSYGWFNQEMLDSYRRPEWRPMLFAQCFIHSNVVERRKFGPIGFCIPYEFNQGDWQASVQFLQNHMATIGDDVKKGAQVSWITVRYMISEIQYGGRITDTKDRTMFNTICEVCMSDKILAPEYKFYTFPGGNQGYGIPMFEEYAKHKEYLDGYPEVDPPEVFGLHSNADIIYRTRQSQQTLGTILDIQPRGAGAGGGKSPDETVIELADDFLKRLPVDWKLDAVRDLMKKINATLPLNIFCRQEIERLNVCIKLIRTTLKDLKLAIAGVVVMSPHLQEARDNLYDAKVPPKWVIVSWPSATMGLWFEEVLTRQRQLDSWSKEDRPPKFWLTGFYNPQGFLTSVRQEVTRAHKNEGWALDDVVLRTEVQKMEKHEVDRPPSEGVYVFGLYLEGAGWDKGKQRLKDPLPKESPKELPVLYVTAVQGDDGKKQPGQQRNKQVINKFDCPVYKYPRRNDINWIFDVQLNCEEEKHHWQLRGACLLCTVE
eukprot:TRINITY_DN7253_c0_g4_i1.p1 TRINITY_DN7253_c0_g4~~TRINITY_DN7253_c0_g4_i1.p1  ORF type:complete len:4646 (+),score=1368.52 TRINITY_DN7253_c0_g4_i1:87-14024(+)